MNMKDLQKFSAFKVTLPMIFLAVPVGITYGFLVVQMGYDAWLAPFSSLLVFSGALQFFGLEMAESKASYVDVTVASFAISIRHMFYGLPLMERYNRMGLAYRIMAIFMLIDETWGLATTTPQRETAKQDRNYILGLGFFFLCYWVIGSALGAYLGKIFDQINTQGTEFITIALFVVLSVEQIRVRPKIFSPLLGFSVAIICALIFGGQNLIFPAVFTIFGALTIKSIYARNHL